MEFLEKEVVLALHDAQLALYGGLAGVRDMGLLESALARPQNSFAYGETDVFALAASLAFGIARNHPFLDGNKRTALHSALTFLMINGAAVPPPTPLMVEMTVQLAEGRASEQDFARWLAQNPLAL